MPSHPTAGGQGAASLGSASPSPSFSFAGILSPREEPQSRASGILQKQSQGPFQQERALQSPTRRWQLLPCSVQECPLTNWEAARYVMRTEAGELQELCSAPHATQICSSSPE